MPDAATYHESIFAIPEITIVEFFALQKLGAVKANVISESLAAPLDGKGDGTALSGSIAEAAGFAKSVGVLVVNAAGNERQNHWGGAYKLSTLGSGYHTWNGNNTVLNPFGPDTTHVYCYGAGTEIDVQM